MVKVTSERLPDAQVVLNIEVEPETVEKASQRAYQSLVNRINVPGFRRGKAPRHLVERMIGGSEALKQEGIERLLPEVFREAIQETGIEPVDQPEFELVSDDPLIVKATVSVQPTVELGDYKSIRMTPVPVDVPYERINETIERLREQQTSWNTVERAARAGDRVTFDVVGTVGAAPTLYDAAGQPLLQTEGREELLRQENAEIELDPTSTTPLPGFQEQIVGMTPKSEKRFVLSLPADWPNEEQRSQSVLCRVQLHEVKEPNAPALNDEFAKSVGEYESLDALREDIRDRLRQQLEHEAQHVFEDSLIGEAVSRSTFEIPPALYRRESERLVQNFGQNLARQRLSLDQYLKLTNKSAEELREEMRPNAEQNLRHYLVLREIGRSENVEVGEEEIEAEVERVIGVLGQQGDPEQFRQVLARPEEREEIRSNLWHRKVINRLIEIAAQPEQAGTTEQAEAVGDASAQEGDAVEGDAEKAPRRGRTRAARAESSGVEPEAETTETNGGSTSS